MTRAFTSNSKIVSTATLICGLALLTSACASHKKPVPQWGGPLPQSSNPAPSQPVGPVVLNNQAIASASEMTGRRTFTQGCTGTFSVRDARTNREISSGRAFNSGTGLIALDRQGRQTRAVSSSTGQSVTFLPDCNCRLGGNQSSDLSTMTQTASVASSAAQCEAG
jgi:hypothetical protein